MPRSLHWLGMLVVSAGVALGCGSAPGATPTQRGSALTVSVPLDPGPDGGSAALHLHWTGAVLALDRRADWWDGGWQFRAQLEVNTDGGVDGFPMLVPVDLDPLIAPDALDPTSVRLVDPLAPGDGGAEVASVFDLGASGRNGVLAFALANAGPGSGGTRPYAIYFDTARRGTKGQPGYVDGTASGSLSNGVLTFAAMGRGASNEASPLGFAGLVLEPGIDTVWARYTAINSSDGSYCSETDAEGQAMCPTAYTSPGRTLLLSTPELGVHRLHATGGALGVRQYTLLGQGSAARVVMVVENDGAVPVTGGMFFDGTDFDVNGTANDMAWLASDQILVTNDATPYFAGLRTVSAPAHVTVEPGPVWAQIDSGTLNDALDGGTADMEGALQFAMPTLAPGESWLLSEAWGVSATGYGDLRSSLFTLTDPPPTQLRPTIDGPFEPSGSFESAVVDLGTAPLDAVTVRWSALIPDGGSLALASRTGASADPSDGGWSGWTPLAQSPAPIVPFARFVQLQAAFASAPRLEQPVELSALELAVQTSPRVRLENLPATAEVGAPLAFDLVARAGDGSVATGYAGSVSFSSSDPAALLPADVTFTAADLGQRHLTGLSFGTPGNQTLGATEATSGQADLATVRVTQARGADGGPDPAAGPRNYTVGCAAAGGQGLGALIALLALFRRRAGSSIR